MWTVCVEKRGEKRGENRRGAFYVMLMMATALTAVGYPGDARAQDEQRPAQVAQQRQHAFNIPPQPLTDALASFGRQSGMQVSVDGDAARGVSSPGVIGSMTAEQALARLLAGTGITYRLTGGNTAMLQRASVAPPGAIQLDPVQVQGFAVPQQAMIDNIPPPYAGGQVATGSQLGILGNKGVMDTPFNQTSYTAKKAQDQQAQTIRDVLVDDPSVWFGTPDGSVGSDRITIRGFDNPGVTTYGGLYGLLPTHSIMMELAERVEILKGPSVMLNGMPPSTSLGGTVNLVAKRAPNEPLTQVTAGYNSTAQFGGHVDVGRRFGSDKQFGIRFNGVARAGQTAVEWTSDQRELGVIGLDYRGDHVRMSFDGGYQYQSVIGVMPFAGVANGVAIPWAPDANKNFGQPWNYQERKDLLGVARIEADMTDRITFYASLGAHDSRTRTLYGSSNVTVTNANGNATATVTKQGFFEQDLTGEVGVRAQLDTGPIGHAVAVSGSLLEQVVGAAWINGNNYATNIYNPTLIPYVNFADPNVMKSSTTSLSSLAFADTLSVADQRVQLTLGARLQRVASQNFSFVNGMPTSGYEQSALSPSAALVFKPWRNVSLYGNFIQGLQQGTIVGQQFANAGAVFAPYKTTQYEVGVKADWGKFTTTASLFQISRPSTITDVATNTLVLSGEQRNQGLEFNFFGEPVEGVRLLGGAMLLNAVLTQTQGGLTNGWTAPSAPAVQLKLGSEWDLPFARGLTLNGRVLYTGSQYIDTTYPRRTLPAWTRFDLGARYVFDNATNPLGRPFAIRFNVENVLDTNYWAGGGSASNLNPGAPRTFRLSTTVDF